jgi:hypothetical protein
MTEYFYQIKVRGKKQYAAFKSNVLFKTKTDLERVCREQGVIAAEEKIGSVKQLSSLEFKMIQALTQTK